MPFSNGEYTKYTEEQLEEQIKQRLRDELEVDELGEYLTAFAESFAQELSETHQPALQRAYESAFLETAEGDDLERLVEWKSVDRREGQRSTGVILFTSNSGVGNTTTIGEGVVVRTGDTEDIGFQTTEQVTIDFLEGFENGLSKYTGDTGDFAADSAEAYSGSNSLLGGDTNSSIYTNDITTKAGEPFSFRVNVEDSSEAWVLFGGPDADNCYSIEINTSADFVSFYTRSSGSDSLEGTKPLPFPLNEWVEVQVEWRVNGDMRLAVYNEAGTFIDATTLQAPTAYSSGGLGFETTTGSVTPRWDAVAEYGATANIEALESGAEGNVGARTITEIPVIPSGVNSIAQHYPTGDQTFTDTSGDTFVTGRSLETDAQLRNRARNTFVGGAATEEGLISAIRQADQDVESITIGNTSGDLDITVLGGEDDPIGEAIYDAKAVTDTTTGSTTVNIETSTGQTRAINFTRPTQVNAVLTMDIVTHSADYEGDNAVIDAVAEYIGGVRADGSRIISLVEGQDIIKSEIESAIMSVNGVVGVTSITNSGSESFTTRADGLDVIDVGAGEVAYFNGESTGQTINTSTATE